MGPPHLICIIESRPTSLKTGWQVYKPVAHLQTGQVCSQFATYTYSHCRCIAYYKGVTHNKVRLLSQREAKIIVQHLIGTTQSHHIEIQHRTLLTDVRTNALISRLRPTVEIQCGMNSHPQILKNKHPMNIGTHFDYIISTHTNIGTPHE